MVRKSKKDDLRRQARSMATICRSRAIGTNDVLFLQMSDFFKSLATYLESQEVEDEQD